MDGQQWILPGELARGHRNRIEQIDTGIYSVHTDPKFAIGQRCLLLQSSDGNVLWDCVSLIDDETIARVRELGGISAIAISHPHYYSTMVDWSDAFGGAPIILHEEDRDWVMRPDSRIEFWSGETHQINAEMTLVQCGGHFEGAQVMYWNRGALFTGDVIQVVADRRWVSFMRSFPNFIPLPAAAVRRIVDAVEPFAFDRIYGAWPGFEIQTDAKKALQRSAERYIRALTEVLH
jgi:glyoxylase-like metal-dependent hydrolase (beta-lactamase superfamily II)